MATQEEQHVFSCFPGHEAPVETPFNVSTSKCVWLGTKSPVNGSLSPVNRFTGTNAIMQRHIKYENTATSALLRRLMILCTGRQLFKSLIL